MSTFDRLNTWKSIFRSKNKRNIAQKCSCNYSAPPKAVFRVLLYLKKDKFCLTYRHIYGIIKCHVISAWLKPVNTGESAMEFSIQNQTEENTEGAAYVHYAAWGETYRG